MSSRGSYSIKKKKEAVRRLSQGGRRARTSHTADPEDSQRHGRVARGKRRSRDSMDDEDRNPRASLFGGRRVIATDSPSSGTHLFIQANLGGQSSGADTPDTDPDMSRRVVASQASPISQTESSSLFGKNAAPMPNSRSGAFPGGIGSSGMFGPPTKSSDESGPSGSGSQFRGSPLKKSLFQPESNSLFLSRGKFGSASTNIFQTSSQADEPTGNKFGQAVTKSPSAEISQESSSLLFSSVKVPESLFKNKEPTPGLDSVTRNLFGKPVPSTSDQNPPLFGKPSTKAPEQSSTSSTKVLFGKEVPFSPPKRQELATRDEPKLQTRALFGKALDSSSHRDRGDASSKRQLSPSRAEGSSKRTLTSFDDTFSSGSQSDITDLETFGTERSKRDSSPKKPVIKRSGLFGKAIAEASGRSRDLARESHRSRSRSPEERKHRSPDRQLEEGQKKPRDENKPAWRSSSSSSSSRRYATSKDIKNLVAITIKRVPASANSRAFLKDFFSKYGSVTRVYPNPNKNSAIVHFSNHESAANAKKKARILKRGTQPVSIFWRQDQTAKSENKPSQDEKRPPSSRHQDDKKSILRQSLAPFNNKAETTLNPEDGTSISAAPQDTSKTFTAGHPKTRNLSVPAHLLSKQVGLTAQERYDILEDRDRIVRQDLKKKSNLTTAGAIRGTCPDMCPEKERYMRVVQRRLHPYEVLPGTADKVNHDTAVKEYSRSSADQEEPLPHEMRPAPVLTMTMNYLMRHVMNMGRDGLWQEWFDFLWSRTRGIRKDITQQDLRDLTAIDLMEKCARFHIFCSHRLCEEDLSTIDPKINNENLTKCMQSLKQFYHDLASEGTVCPNEAEFRAYDVLLNLNDRDILRQVQQYRPEVRGSEAVKFALKAFSAVSSNNYVKFFKLVRATTYLNACIMHRYFTQVRNMALDVMNKAYTISNKKGSHFPLANIKATLAFDDLPQALEFCMSHNLVVQDDVVEFSRTAFLQPQIIQSAERSRTIIEAKNTLSIGEVVNGGPLPPDVVYKPSSSFDENGNYKGYTVIVSETAESSTDTISSKTQLTESIAEPADNQEVTAPPTVTTEFPQAVIKTPYSNTEIKEVAREMFLDVINEMVRELSGNFLAWIRLIQVGSAEILQDTVDQATSPMVRQIAQDVFKEQQRHEEQMAELNRRRRQEQEALEERRQLERRERLEQMARGVAEDVIDSVVDRDVHLVATTEMRAVQQQLKRESIERCTLRLHQELIEETLLLECHQISTEVIQSETALRDHRLAESERAVVLGRLARYLQRWHKVYTKRIHLKRTLLTFPAAPPNQTAKEQLRVLWAGRTDKNEVTEGQRRRDVTLDSPFSIVTGREHIAKSILQLHYLKNLRHQQAWSPLDLPSILCNPFQSHHALRLAGSYHGNRQQHHYWKLVVSLPSVKSHDQRLLCDWLKAKFRRGKLAEGVRKTKLEDNSQVETLSLYSSRAPHISPSQPCSLSLCTKAMTGTLDSTSQHQRRHQLLGTSGILFALDPTSGDQNYWLGAKARLDSILQAKPMLPPPPVVIVLLDWPATEHAQSLCEEMLHLRQLSKMGLVSSYRFLEVPRNVESPDNSRELSDALEWLASRCPPPSVLSEDSLKGYLDTGITEFFSLPLYEDARTRRDAGLPEQDCHSVIELYNATVRHLADVASSGTLTSLSWQPTEFTKTDKHTELPSADWNAKETIQQLRDVILSLVLPDLPPIDEEEDWENVCELCLQYLQSLPGSNRAKVPLFARVQRILDKCRRTFEDTCYLEFDAPGCEPLAGHVPWTRIIEECIDYLMSTVQSHDLDGNEEKPVTVFYIQSEFDSFKIPQLWRNGVRTTTEESFIQPSRFLSQVASAVQQKQSEHRERQLDATLADMMENQKPSATVLEREPSFVISAKDSADAVKTVLSAAKEESKKFDDQLQKWLYNTEEMTSQDGLSTPRIRTDDHNASALSPPNLEESLAYLRLTMESEQRANRLNELRLASLLSL